MKKNTVTLIDNSVGKRYEYNILESTRGPSVVDIRSFFADTGMFTYDPGFTSTASCSSSITFIDGGKGQLSAVANVLEELAVSGVTLIGVAKGADRKPGMEQLFLFGREAPIILPANSPALHLVQQIRDEAHRFAITGHRQRRDRSRKTSVLESVPVLPSLGPGPPESTGGIDPPSVPLSMTMTPPSVPVPRRRTRSMHWK